jgi:hypothetical protein
MFKFDARQELLISQAVPRRAHYDYIIASHVIEHVPDLLGFLLDCQMLMKPAGVLALAIPDKRACFDFLSPISTTGQVLQAHSRNARRPDGGAVFDHVANFASMQGEIAWPLGTTGPLSLRSSLSSAYESFSTALASHAYVDVHVWRFVPSSFRLILGDLRCLGLSMLNEKAFLATSNFEFFAFLSADAPPDFFDRAALALAALEEQAAVAVDATQRMAR